MRTMKAYKTNFNPQGEIMCDYCKEKDDCKKTIENQIFCKINQVSIDARNTTKTLMLINETLIKILMLLKEKK